MYAGSWLRARAFWGLDRVRGGAVGRHLRALEHAFAHPEEAMQQRQAQLAAFLTRATDTTPFYREFAGASLDRFPIISKRTISENAHVFRSSAYDFAGLPSMTTSGSYGTPFRFYLTPDKRARQRAEIIFFNRWAGYDIGIPYAYMRVVAPNRRQQRLKNETLMNPARCTVDWLNRQRGLLRQRRIRILIGYVSAIRALTETCRAHGDTPADFAVRGIITSSEPLSDEDRALMHGVFGCPVISRYSTNEFGVLASELPHRDVHITNVPSYVIEVLDTERNEPVGPGQSGRVVITDLFSHAMPLIRYDIGDVAALVSVDAQREHVFPMLARVEGRKVESLFDTRGNRLSPFTVNNLMASVEGVVQYQIVQRTTRAYRLSLVALPGFQQQDFVRQALLGYFGSDAELTIEYVDDIAPLPSGKRPYIRSELPAPEASSPSANTIASVETGQESNQTP